MPCLEEQDLAGLLMQKGMMNQLGKCEGWHTLGCDINAISWHNFPVLMLLFGLLQVKGEKVGVQPAPTPQSSAIPISLQCFVLP
mgnify:CR=1 FL=1